MRNWNDDPYTKKARKENFEARSVYKLEEIDKRERIFSGVRTVLDLGAAPGSWTQYCLKKLPKTDSKIIAVDISPIQVQDPRLIFLQESIESVDLSPYVGDGKVDMVLSDMAPKTSGVHDRDVYLSFELASLAFHTCEKHLKMGGAFVVKLFMGESFEEFHKLLKANFSQVRLLRPDSTRKHSREIFFIGKGFKTKK
ncbi:MAG: RlmE family RNA methyltransferase [Deltaproteobacteria bacterium]|nr:RlmE family RNA methyltransferase [Deltaproteobacteria bacterium]